MLKFQHILVDKYVKDEPRIGNYVLIGSIQKEGEYERIFYLSEELGLLYIEGVFIGMEGNYAKCVLEKLSRQFQDVEPITFFSAYVSTFNRGYIILNWNKLNIGKFLVSTYQEGSKEYFEFINELVKINRKNTTTRFIFSKFKDWSKDRKWKLMIEVLETIQFHLLDPETIENMIEATESYKNELFEARHEFIIKYFNSQLGYDMAIENPFPFYVIKNKNEQEWAISNDDVNYCFTTDIAKAYKSSTKQIGLVKKNKWKIKEECEVEKIDELKMLEYNGKLYR